MRRKTSALLIAFILFLASGSDLLSVLAENNGYTAVPIAQAPDTVNSEYKVVSQNEKLVLLFNYSTYDIIVENRYSSYLWKSCVDDNTILDSTNEHWKYYMTSMFVLNYVNKNELVQKEPMKAFSSSPKCKVTCDVMRNTIKMSINFRDLHISFIAEVKLDNDSLIISIPAQGIQEEGDCWITGIEVMPFFGSADRKTKGYIFYPDGCGALMKYEKAANRQILFKPFILPVYTQDYVCLEDYLSIKRKGMYQAMLPVYGVKNNSDAYTAIVVKGDETSNISISPDGYVVGLNRACFEFTYRHPYEVYLSNISVAGKRQNEKSLDKRYDKVISKSDHAVRYVFLDGEDASYSGMAAAYRNYLLNNNLMNKVIKNGDDIPLGLDLFAGIVEDRLLFDRFVKMTSLTQAHKITDAFIHSGVEKLHLLIKGWTKGGYGLYPWNWKADDRLGGIQALISLNRFTKANGIPMFLQVNFTYASKQSGGFSERKDVLRLGNSLPAGNRDNSMFLLGPASVKNKSNTFLENYGSLFECGTAIECLGKFIYHDNSNNQRISRLQTIETWESIMADIRKKTGMLAVEGGNAYVLKYADRLLDIPSNSSNYYLNDEDIPFYQMVVHGYIPYTSEPGNLFYDFRKQTLKWIEYGYMPSFELTQESSGELKHTEYNKLFTSSFGKWIKPAIDIYKEFNSNLAAVWSSTIEKHEKTSENISITTYSNGIKIYINYGNTKVCIDGLEIMPEDYKVVGFREVGK